MKREIRSISNQLYDYNILNSKKKISINLGDKDIEKLAVDINGNLHLIENIMLEYKDSEEKLKIAIASISHDIRTPLTSILGYIQMLKRKEINDEKYNEYINIVEKRSNNLKELLDEFFELSVLESSGCKVNLQSLNVNNILCESITAFYDKFQEHSISPQIDILSESLKVVGDESYLRRSIDNLITNMIKHSKGKEVIRLYKQNEIVRLEFENEVENLNEDDLNLMFDKFFTKDISRNPNIKSTGLGLTITKKLIEKINGKIYAKLNGDILKIYINFNKI